MNTFWFKKTGWAYIPVHFMGYLVTIAAILFMLPIVFAINRNGHSISDDLYELFIYTSCTSFWWKWVAEKTSFEKFN